MGNRWDVTREVKSINEQQDNGRLQSGRRLSWLGSFGVRLGMAFLLVDQHIRSRRPPVPRPERAGRICRSFMGKVLRGAPL